VAEALKRGKPSSLAMLVDAYLSTVHRDSLATSCAVATLAVNDDALSLEILKTAAGGLKSRLG
jgi:hypothetical protein